MCNFSLCLSFCPSVGSCMCQASYLNVCYLPVKLPTVAEMRDCLEPLLFSGMFDSKCLPSNNMKGSKFLTFFPSHFWSSGPIAETSIQSMGLLQPLIVLSLCRASILTVQSSHFSYICWVRWILKKNCDASWQTWSWLVWSDTARSARGVVLVGHDPVSVFSTDTPSCSPVTPPASQPAPQGRIHCIRGTSALRKISVIAQHSCG